MIRKDNISVGILLLLIGVVGCTEPFEAETQSFENALVIDALLTDEEKQHRVILARSYRFEDDGPTAERNANVQVSDDMGNTYEYLESEPGRYTSSVAFRATTGVAYELRVETSDGNVFRSTPVTVPQRIEIEEVKAEVITTDLGQEGLQVSLTNSDTDSRPNYFRYEYDETYKIVAPYYNPLEFEILDDEFYTEGDHDGYQIILVKREDESLTCYGTDSSVGIILSDSQRNVDDQTGKAVVRFLKSDNFIIAQRYSILIKQFALTREAHGFYESLEDFSNNESIFSEIQPGFLAGNISAVDEDQLVLGNFEVSSMQSRRYFLNYTDFFPNRPRPYAIDCEATGAPPLFTVYPHIDPETLLADSADAESPLIQAIQAGIVAYHAENEDYRDQILIDDIGAAPYFVKATACIDCRALGSNVKPDFWIEE